MLSIRNISVALFITTLSSLSVAQSTAPSTTPDTVGVDPAEAREAMEKARRRDAEAAVIRTDDTAAQEAREAAGAARDGAAAVGNRTSNAAQRATGSVGGGTTEADRANSAAGSDAAADRSQIARAPRADRN
jgi:hypothetical protein